MEQVDDRETNIAIRMVQAYRKTGVLMELRRKRGVYERYIKRLLDIAGALLAMLLFSWLYVLVAVLVRVRIGKPVIFMQPRPGLVDPKTGKETIFRMYKFRTMTQDRDGAGNLKPDCERLTPFGKKLRATSLDELPGVFNILKGDMSFIGPRPQLVKDMVFMSRRQRMRHTAKPGLSGLAQVMGRNALSWEEKLHLDLKYIKNVNFRMDMKLVWMTCRKMFQKAGNADAEKETSLALDYGDALLKAKKVSKQTYDALQAEAEKLLGRGCQDWKTNRNHLCRPCWLREMNRHM